MSEESNNKNDLSRFRPQVSDTENIKATRYLDLCKSCGQCVEKCPVDAISWSEDELGMLGEPAIVIDMDKCIGCELCEQICPDAAIEILNRKTEQATEKKDDGD